MRRLDPLEVPPALTTLFGADDPVFVLPSAASEAEQQAWRELAAAWAKPGEPKLLLDGEIETLPDGSVWILGWGNAFAAALRRSSHRAGRHGERASRSPSRPTRCRAPTTPWCWSPAPNPIPLRPSAGWPPNRWRRSRVSPASSPTTPGTPISVSRAPSPRTWPRACGSRCRRRWFATSPTAKCRSWCFPLGSPSPSCRRSSTPVASAADRRLSGAALPRGPRPRRNGSRRRHHLGRAHAHRSRRQPCRRRGLPPDLDLERR